MTVSAQRLVLPVLLGLLLIGGGIATVQVNAQEQRDGESRPQAPAPAPRLGERQSRRDALADSIRRASREGSGGRVLSAEHIQADGRDVTRVKTMDERGRVRATVYDPPGRRPPPPPRRDDE